MVSRAYSSSPTNKSDRHDIDEIIVEFSINNILVYNNIVHVYYLIFYWQSKFIFSQKPSKFKYVDV